MADARYFIRIRGKVLGPFDMVQLRRQRERGQVSRFHEISEDRITWVPASSLVDLFPPDGSPPPARHPDPAGITGVRPSGGGGDRGGAVWHYTNLRGKQVGPVTREQLLALLDEGTIDAQTLVWNPSLQEWAPLESVPGLLAGGAARRRAAACASRWGWPRSRRRWCGSAGWARRRRRPRRDGAARGPAEARREGPEDGPGRHHRRARGASSWPSSSAWQARATTPSTGRTTTRPTRSPPSTITRSTASSSTTGRRSQWVPASCWPATPDAA